MFFKYSEKIIKNLVLNFHNIEKNSIGNSEKKLKNSYTASIYKHVVF